MHATILSYLRTFATSRAHLERSTAIAGGLSATTTLEPSTIAGIALAEGAAQTDGDLGILNFALTLEHFENALYRGILSTGLLTGKALQYAKAYGAHESTHVTALTDTITKLGGTPVKEQSAYNWPALTTEAEIIKLLATVEDVGASAYLGAAPLVKSPDLLTVAVQIHTVEAEHATAFRFLSGQDAVPFAFATPRTKDEVLQIVTPFLMAPAVMPNTGLGDDAGLQALGIAGGLAAIAAGVALSRSSQPAQRERE
jgi:hypothetical protein